ncbi:unnamed protein product [Nezara viridula]|uniref:Uncharacterized protein n=1 Tax=Nezara viridula TaxID=85310 RepID=A0A9P0MMQ4_NEZVI|nr:unnamed protein product [Nezara viridula]
MRHANDSCYRDKVSIYTQPLTYWSTVLHRTFRRSIALIPSSYQLKTQDVGWINKPCCRWQEGRPDSLLEDLPEER